MRSRKRLPMRLPSKPIRLFRKGSAMIIVKLDMLDGKGLIDVAVGDHADADRLRMFVNHADESFADQERWVKVRDLMTHEHNGPNVGWTLGMLMPGDDPDEAIDEFKAAP